MAFFQEGAQIIVDVRGWLFLLLTGAAALYILGDVFEYIRGKGSEKAEAWKNIEDKLKMIAGAYFLVWFVTYVAGRMSKVNASYYIENTRMAINYIRTIVS